MKSIQNFKITDLLLSLGIFIIGLLLMTNSSAIIDILSYIIGGILGLIGIVNIISYLTHRSIVKSTSKLFFGVILIIIGALLAIFPNIVDITIRVVFGSWILFMGVSRLIVALTIKKVDQTGFKTFLITSIIMVLAGVIILISFYELLGLLLAIYAISEIVGYIYFNLNKKKYETIFNFEETKDNKNVKKIKKEIKEKEAIDAVIDE